MVGGEGWGGDAVRIKILFPASLEGRDRAGESRISAFTEGETRTKQKKKGTRPAKGQLRDYRTEVNSRGRAGLKEGATTKKSLDTGKKNGPDGVSRNGMGGSRPKVPTNRHIERPAHLPTRKQLQTVLIST